MKNENIPEMIHQLSRLKWACRRGMLELDVLLGNFLENGYARLSDAEKHIFVKLLSCTDPELFTWLMGAAEPDDEELRQIIRKIKHEPKPRL